MDVDDVVGESGDEGGMEIDPAILGEGEADGNGNGNDRLSPSLPSASSSSPSPPSASPMPRPPRILDIPSSPPPPVSSPPPPPPNQRTPAKHVRRLSRPARKHPPPRETTCGLCQGHDGRNRSHRPERMVSCAQCGRSAHPTCLGLAGIARTLHGYDWKCFKCKDCEVCWGKREKEGDNIVLCDTCDRGWHQRCVDPLIKDLPGPGEDFFCPICEGVVPADPPTHNFTPVVDEQPDEEMEDGGGGGHEQDVGEEDEDDSTEENSADEDYAESSFENNASEQAFPSSHTNSRRSTSRTRTRDRAKGKLNGKSPSKGKGKGKAIAVPPVKRPRRTSTRADSPTPSPTTPTPKTSKSAKSGKSRRLTTPLPSTPPARQPTPPSPILSTFPRLRRLTVRPLLPPPPPPQTQGRTIIKLSTKVLNKEMLKQQIAFEKQQFGDVLGEKEASCEGTRIEPGDKKRWEVARVRAEERLGAGGGDGGVTPAPSVGGAETPRGLGISAPAASRPSLPASPFPSSSSLTFSLPPLRATRAQLQHQLSFTASALAAPSTSASPAKSPPQAVPQRVKTIRFGAYDIDTWYDAPFPEEYAHVPEGRMWICEFCLKYMKTGFMCERHKLKCKARHPPGDEIYRSGPVSIFEVDGRKNKIYCQNVCLLAKMFLDHKTLFYDVEPFLFYVMTEVDDVGARFVGYFSKEKRCPSGYNVSCIMTLPARQRKGWGNLLIGFSYLLSKKEGRIGTPERPLSGLGEVAYRNYWTLTLMQFLHRTPSSPPVRIEHIVAATAMTPADIVKTLTELGMLVVSEKEPREDQRSPAGQGKKGKSSAAAGGGTNGNKMRGRNGHRPSQTPGTIRRNAFGKEEELVPIPSSYSIVWDPVRVQTFVENWQAKGYLVLQPDRLKWSPFIVERTKKTDVVGLEGMGATNLSAYVLPPVNGLVNGANGATATAATASSSSQAEDVPMADAPAEHEHEHEHAQHTEPHTVEEATQALNTVLAAAEQDVRPRQRTRTRTRTSSGPGPGTSPTTPRRRTRAQVADTGEEETFEALPMYGPMFASGKRRREESGAPANEGAVGEEEQAQEQEQEIEVVERPSPAKKRRIVRSSSPVEEEPAVVTGEPAAAPAAPEPAVVVVETVVAVPEPLQEPAPTEVVPAPSSPAVEEPAAPVQEPVILPKRRAGRPSRASLLERAALESSQAPIQTPTTPSLRRSGRTRSTAPAPAESSPKTSPSQKSTFTPTIESSHLRRSSRSHPHVEMFGSPVMLLEEKEKKKAAAASEKAAATSGKPGPRRASANGALPRSSPRQRSTRRTPSKRGVPSSDDVEMEDAPTEQAATADGDGDVQMDDLVDEDAEGEEEDMDAEGEPDPDVV